MKVKVKSWTAVATWRWIANDENCGICRMAFDGCCPDCKLPGDDCPLVWGQCSHCFHMHCIVKWLNSQQVQQQCPMCRQEWKFKEWELTIVKFITGTKEVQTKEMCQDTVWEVLSNSSKFQEKTDYWYCKGEERRDLVGAWHERQQIIFQSITVLCLALKPFFIGYWEITLFISLNVMVEGVLPQIPLEFVECKFRPLQGVQCIFIYKWQHIVDIVIKFYNV